MINAFPISDSLRHQALCNTGRVPFFSHAHAYCVEKDGSPAALCQFLVNADEATIRTFTIFSPTEPTPDQISDSTSDLPLSENDQHIARILFRGTLLLLADCGVSMVVWDAEDQTPNLPLSLGFSAGKDEMMRFRLI